MTIDELALLLYDVYQMDIWTPPPMFKWKEDFKEASYSDWAVEEFKRYAAKQLYPRTGGTVEEFIEIAREFRDKMIFFSDLNSTNRKLFSIALGMAENILDLLRAMK